MVRAKLLYAAVLITLAVFYVLYIDSFSLLMLLCAVILPVFLKLGLLWMHFTSECHLSCGAPSCTEGDSIPVTVTLESRCPLFFPRAEADIEVKHAFGRKPEPLHLKFPVQAHNNTRLTFYLHAECCGMVEVRLTKLRVFDMLRLFHTKVCPAHAVQLLVLPKPVFLPIEETAPPVGQPESERYADRPGDDPSEIFGIRAYQPGDPVSRMHWKLSARSDTMLFKEFSMPIGKNCLLYLEFVPGASLTDARALLTLYYSIAYRIIMDGLLCELAWHDGREVVICQPDAEGTLEAAFKELYDALFQMQSDPESFREAFDGKVCSSATLLTNCPETALLAPLEHVITANKKNLLVVTGEEAHLQSDAADIQLIRPDVRIPERIIL